MLGNIFTRNEHYPNPTEKQSWGTSHLHTTITTHLETHHNEPEPSPSHADNWHSHTQPRNTSSNQNADIFQSSLCFKLQELEEKSSKIISQLPNIHSKLLKAQTYARLPLGRDNSAYGNKLKIIKDLQEKIDQLETNINNPHIDYEYMRNISKEINLDFQNYYQQIKEVKDKSNDKHDQSICSEESIESKSEIEEETKLRRVGETQTSIVSSHQITSPRHIYVPKFIQIEIPYQIYKPSPIHHNSSGRASSDSKDSLPVDSCNHHKSQSNDSSSQQLSSPKNISGSSIQNIITHFNQKCYPHLGSNQMDYNYRVIQVEHGNQQILEKFQFHLPLNSYERCESEKGESEKIILKKTDRSNISSSNSEVQHLRDEIWNKEEMEFKEEHLSLVKEREQTSEHHSRNNYSQDHEDREKILIELNDKINTLTSQNIQLKGSLETMTQQQQTFKEKLFTLQTRNSMLQMQFLHDREHMQEIKEQNRELNVLVIHFKEELFNKQNQLQHLVDKIEQLTENYHAKLDEKQGDLNSMALMMHQKDEDNQELSKLNEEIKKIIHNKEMFIQKLVQENEAAVQELKEELAFYKAKVEEQGINIGIDEVNILRDIIQDKDHTQRQKLEALSLSIQKKYATVISQLQCEKQKLQSQLLLLRKHQNKSQLKSFEDLPHELKAIIQNQLSQLMLNYDDQLCKKQQQIVQLKKISSQFKKQLSQKEYASEEQIKTIANIKNILLKQKLDKENISNNMVQIIYIIDRLLKNIKIYEYSANKQKEERAKMTKKISNLNLYFSRELQKTQQSNSKLGKQLQKTKQVNSDCQRQIKKLNQKLQLYKKKINTFSSDNNPLSVNLLQNQFLSIQNAKLKTKYEKLKAYSQQLQSKMVSNLLQQDKSYCDLIESHKQQKILEKKQQQMFKKLSGMMSEIKEQQNKSVIMFNVQQSRSRINNFEIKSSVISITNKPANNRKGQTMKALIAPLPQIPKNNLFPSTTAPTPLSLQKMIQKRMINTEQLKRQVSLKLIQLGIQLIKVSKKLFSLKPTQIMVTITNNNVQVVLRRQFGNSTQQDEKSLIYRAPQVLLGFTESESSLVWSIGLMIDAIYHQKIFYKKINEILSHKDNYFVRKEEVIVRQMLQKMMVKNQKQRISLVRAKETLLSLIL